MLKASRTTVGASAAVVHRCAMVLQSARATVRASPSASPSPSIVAATTHRCMSSWKFWKKDPASPSTTGSATDSTVVTQTATTTVEGGLDPELRALLTDPKLHTALLDTLAASGKLSDARLAALCGRSTGASEMALAMSTFAPMMARMVVAETKTLLGRGGHAFSDTAVKHLTDTATITLVLKDHTITQVFLEKLIRKIEEAQRK